jgi:uncharacterized protein (UPF0147 family)
MICHKFIRVVINVSPKLPKSQCVVLQLSSKITYICWRAMGETESVRGSATIQQDHVQLLASDGRDRVSAWFCNYPARSRTSCWRAMGETESVRGSATIQQDHVQPVGERWERQSQCVVLQLSSKITYRVCGSGKITMGETESVRGSATIQQDHVLLLASDGRDRVSAWFCNYPARSRTSVGERWERQSQCVVLQLSSKITYSLLASDGRDRVSAWFCNYPARSRTSCWRAMGETESVRGSATIQQDHVLPVGERWERQSQCVVLQLSSKITYKLLASDGRDRVSAWFCNYPARSRTDCWRAMGETESVRGSATIQQDHVLPVGERWERQSQCVVLQLSSKITYKLLASDGRDRVSAWFCNYPARSRTGCWRAMGETESVRGSATIQQDHVQAVGERWERQCQCVVFINGRYSQLGVFLVQCDHAPSVSWRRVRRIEFKVSRSVYCLERRRKCGTDIEQFFVLSFSMRWMKF